MAIGICLFFQETNSFSPVKTGVAALREEGMLCGEMVGRKFAGTETEVGGALDILDDGKSDIVFLPSLWLMPAGPLTREVLGRFAAEFENALLHLNERLSAVFVSLHGCLAAENHPDATGWFLERLRALAPTIPIVASADFHANVTERMLKHADLIVGYRTYPHSDLRETGRRAALCLKRLLAERLRPKGMRLRLPLIVPTETSQHSAAPMRRVFGRLAAIERETGWPTSCFCPHPWLNVPDFSVALLAYAHGDNVGHTQRLLAEAAQQMWNSRDKLYRSMPDLAEAWRQVEASAPRPVILVDSGDVVLAGAPGDSTAVIRFLDTADTALRCLLHITDPNAVNRMWNESRDKDVRCVVGAQWGREFYTPVELACRLQAVSNASYMASGDYLGGIRVDVGRRMVLRWRQHTLVLAERPDPAADPAFFRSLRIEPREYDVVMVKSHNTFRPAYRSITETIVRAATPGATSPDLRSLPYRPEMRRLYPLSEATFNSGAGDYEQR